MSPHPAPWPPATDARKDALFKVVSCTLIQWHVRSGSDHTQRRDGRHGRDVVLARTCTTTHCEKVIKEMWSRHVLATVSACVVMYRQGT